MDIKTPVRNFFTDISNFFRFKRVLGVDIGTVAIKILEAERRGEAFYLSNYGILETRDYLERSNAVIQNGSFPPAKRETAELLRILKDQIKPKTTRAVASIPSFAAFIVPLDIPAMGPDETEKVVRYQARIHVPIPISEARLDWFKSEDFTDKNGKKFQRIVLTAIPEDFVSRYKEIFKHAGLSLAAVEIENQALVRSLLSPRDPTTAIVDIGAESTSVTFVEGNTMKKVVQSDYGGLSLTHALSKSLGLSPKRAEDLKRRQGISGPAEERELSTSLKTFVDVIINEVRRAKDDFEKQNNKKVERFTLVGGGALLPGFQAHAAGRLGIPFMPPRPLAGFKYPSKIEPVMRGLNAELATAAGLVLRYN